MINYRQFFSRSARGMKRSEIRELLKLTRKEGIISFAGGLPAPELFPVNEITDIVEDLMSKVGTTMLQYGPTEGDPLLREQLVEMLRAEGVELNIDNLFIVTSSQQGLDLISKILVDPGDIIMSGTPTYVGALGAFNAYGAEVHGIRLDNRGINTALLEYEITRLTLKGRKPKAIYVIPDFQNPTGITLDIQRRKELIHIAEKHDLILIEDSPYRQLRFEGEPVKPIISMNSERVISLYTFSKILVPGFRLGWMAGPKELIEKAIVAKQSTDLCAPTFNQMVVAEFIRRGLLDKQIPRIRDAYRDNRDFMLSMLEKHMPSLPGLKWTKPEGGLFLWVTLPDYMDANTMFLEAVEKQVAYVVGSAFDPDGQDTSSFRLNFSYANKHQIEEGIKRLAGVIEARASEREGVSTPIAP